ncbi:hypothetical protein SynROS8604_00106 [Synechococcus sp. ROS8604]|nr:hypothetical protein SynROS8604_00106 [Synechococcus sp. ROS8604]
MKRKVFSAFEFELLAGQRDCGGISIFVTLFLLVWWQGIGSH